MSIIELFSLDEKSEIENWDMSFANPTNEEKFQSQERRKGKNLFKWHIYGLAILHLLYIANFDGDLQSLAKHIIYFILLIGIIYLGHKYGFRKRSEGQSVWHNGAIMSGVNLIILETIFSSISHQRDVIGHNALMNLFPMVLILIYYSYCFYTVRLHIKVLQLLILNYLIIAIRAYYSDLHMVYNYYTFLLSIFLGYTYIYFQCYMKEKSLRSNYLLKINDKEKKSSWKRLFNMNVNPLLILGEDKLYFWNTEFKKQLSFTAKPRKDDFDNIVKNIISEKDNTSLYDIILRIHNDYKSSENKGQENMKHLGEFIFNSNGTKTYEISCQMVKYKCQPGILFNFMNVTDVKEAQRERLSREFRNLLLTTASHELRTPLNGIFGNLQLLDTCTDPDDIKRKLFFIRNSSEFLLHIINNILEYCKYESGSLEVTCDETDIYSIFEDCKKMMNFQCQQRGVKLEINLSPEIPEIICTDGAKVKQILLNLLSNAAKYTYQGSIIVTGNYVNNILEVIIMDTGIGIPEEKKNELFKIFGRISGDDGKRHSKGLNSGGSAGLGLTISQALLTKLGTKLTYTANNQKGSIFSFGLYTTLYRNRKLSMGGHKFGPRFSKRSGSVDIHNVKRFRSFNPELKARPELDLTFRPILSQPQPWIITEPPASEAVNSRSIPKGLLINLHKCEDSHSNNSKNSRNSKSHRNKKSFGDESRTNRLNNESLGDWFKQVDEEISSEEDVDEGLLHPYVRQEYSRSTPNSPPKIGFPSVSQIDKRPSLIGKDLSIYNMNPKQSSFNISGNLIRSQEERKIPPISPVRAMTQLHLPEPSRDFCSCADLLIVDDSAFNLDILKGLLKKLGYTAAKANNGKQATVMAETMLLCGCKRIQGILMDIEMPIMNGYEATIQLKSQMKSNKFPSIPIIAVTAYTDEGTKEKCIDVEMDNYISKPIFLEELTDVLLKHEIIPTTSRNKIQPKEHRNTFFGCPIPATTKMEL